MNYDPATDLARCLEETAKALPSIEGQTAENWPKQLRFILEGYSFQARACEGEAAFEFDEESKTICFNEHSLLGVRNAALSYADELSSEWLDRDRERAAETAVNLFVVHELTHIVQNFPHYHMVPELKAGMGVEALALLDVTADFHAAWVVANVEWRIAGCPSDISVSDYFTNMLMLAYVIGARGFPPLGRAHKVQRFVGVLLGAILNQSNQAGLLDREHFYTAWTPRVPLLAFDFNKTGSLNAFMTQPQLGPLLRNSVPIPPTVVTEIWNGVGTLSTKVMAEKLAACLAKAGILREAVAQAQRAVSAKQKL